MVDYAGDSTGANQKAQNVENIYANQGAAAGLAALRDDFTKTMNAPGVNPADGTAQNWMEYSRLEATDTGISVMNGLAIEWASQQLNQRGATELNYSQLLPQKDEKADPNLPDVQLDKIMVRDLKTNWTDNTNITTAGQDDTPIDNGTIPLSSSNIQSARASLEQDRQVMIAEENPLPPPKPSLWQSLILDLGLSAVLLPVSGDSQQ